MPGHGRYWRFAALLLLGSAFVAPPASAAVAQSVTCGQRITMDTTLRSDLLGCPRRGIVIGADNITLDLNGHTIGGDGTPAECPNSVCDVGVDNGAGHDGVTIRGGTVRRFTVGVYATDDVAGCRWRGLNLSRNSQFGAVLQNSTGCHVTDDVFSDNGISGLVVTDTRNASLARNTISGSHGYGLAMFSVDGSSIRNNTMYANDHGMLADGSSRNVIADNVVSHSGGSSIDFGNGAGANRIVRNRLTDNGDGIIATNAHDNTISDNVVTGTGFFGFPDTGGFGLILDGSARTTVQGNIIVGGRGPALLITSLDSPVASSSNLVSNNTVNSRGADGVLVNGDATGTVLVGNTAIGSGDDGIDVDAPGTTVTGNTANFNHDLGIEAVRRVKDGGGNRAIGNGNSAQCTSVTCHP
jgi:parallel beta-helix repeat protein